MLVKQHIEIADQMVALFAGAFRSGSVAPFGLVHFSYGMVELPNGKMKSREGTVVDADDLMAQSGCGHMCTG